MHVIVWEYMVRPDRVAEFEALYRPEGPWVELFRRSLGFLGTTLMRDARDPQRYLITDRWTSEAAYAAFPLEFANEYRALSERGERLHRAEHLIGHFDMME